MWESQVNGESAHKPIQKSGYSKIGVKGLTFRSILK